MVSVIIPTHNRSNSLLRLLDALALQDHPLEDLEVLVVANGCTDGTEEVLNKSAYAYALVVLVTAEKGAASARQWGASKARGEQLVFLDDDIEPGAGMLSAFVQALRHERMVVMGKLSMMPQVADDPQRILLLQWWEQKYQEMGEPGHRFTYEDLLSGCFSLSASLFREAGGFDVSLACREDHELGIRLIRLGAELGYEPRAAGIHHDGTDLGGSYRRKKMEGYWDMVIAREYPGYLASTRLKGIIQRKRLMRTVFRIPVLLHLMKRVQGWTYACSALLKWRMGMLVASQSLQDIFYLQGVRMFSGNRRDIEASMLQPPSLITKEVQWQDLRSMKDEVVLEADIVVLRCGSFELCRIGPMFAAEPMRRIHVVQVLQQQYSERVLIALALLSRTDQKEVYDGNNGSLV